MKGYKSYLDRSSIGLSALCMIHCIILPIFISTLAVFGFEILENSSIEWITIFCSLIAGGWAIGRSYRNYHQHLAVPILFALGLVLMIIANYTEGRVSEMLLKGSGTTLIISAHISNWKKCMVCCKSPMKETKFMTEQ